MTMEATGATTTVTLGSATANGGVAPVTTDNDGSGGRVGENVIGESAGETREAMDVPLLLMFAAVVLVGLLLTPNQLDQEYSIVGAHYFSSHDSQPHCLTWPNTIRASESDTLCG